MSILISAVICTYNRCSILGNAIESLCNQTLCSSQYEIIVVDNNSTDATREVVESFLNFYNIRYLFESRQGLSYARNSGWENAQGKYIAYFDDDCQVPTNWMTEAKKIIENLEPYVFGGPTYPFYDLSKPQWFKDSYQTFTYGEEPFFLLDGFLKGTNIAFHGKLFKHLGGFNPNLGMIGKNIGYGEEVALQKLVRSNFPKQAIYYDPKLYINDLVRPEKMDIYWLAKAAFISGRFSYYMFPDQKTLLYKILASILYRLFAISISFFKAFFTRDRSRYLFMENYCIELTFQHLRALGRSYEQILTKRLFLKQILN